MSNQIERFVSYELALELKKLGFKRECLAYYDDDKVCRWSSSIDYTSSLIKMYPDYVLAPIYQDVFDWFRENNIEVYFFKNEADPREQCFKVEYGNWDLLSEKGYINIKELREEAIKAMIVIAINIHKKLTF